ncbi:MAG: hypothetical protein ABIP50_00295 [Candidatus Saccharimonadales bacterium]
MIQGYRVRPLFYSLAVVLFAVFAVVLMPRFASAGAGDSPTGGSPGCGDGFSTCYGATWRYYTTNSDDVPIWNVFKQTQTHVRGCATAGGFFAYVLVATDGSRDTRSWTIGSSSGDNDDISRYFGGGTNYYPAQDASNPLPSTLVNDRGYSWPAVHTAFNEAAALGQNNGYTWSGSSNLSWFCYTRYNFNLTPSITGTPSVSDAATDNVKLTPTVKNDGPTSSNGVEWRVTKFRVDPGGSVPLTGTGGIAPVTYYGNKDAVDVKTATGTIFGVGTSNLTNNVGTQSIADWPVGTRICFGLSVKTYSFETTDWRYSAPFCITVTKKPKIQVLGSDVLVGRPFAGSVSMVSLISVGVTNQITKQYGSWAEYGVVASGAIKGLASGSGYAGGISKTTDCAVSLLTFANTKAKSPGGKCVDQSSLGNFDTNRTIPDISNRFLTSAAPKLTGTVDLGASGKQGVYKTDTNAVINLTTTGLGKGQWIVINAPTATVNILGNITYDNGPFTALSDIPQLVIIANHINIRSNVTRVDAWLIANGAEGTLNTCRDAADSGDMINLSSALCTNTLTINGPVMAKKVYLHRTAGATQGAGAGDPAEVFNLRPDAYFWAINRASTTGRVQTVYSQELPPRY